MVVLAVPFFAKVCVFEGVLIGFMDAGTLALRLVTLSESSLLVLAGSGGKA